MRIVPNWRRVLRYGWSVRLNALAIAFIVGEVCLPLIKELYPIPAGAFLFLSALCSGGSFWARFIKQNNVSGGDA